MRLHGERVLGLREDLEQLVIRQKVEARESDSFGLEVLRQSLLDELEHEIRFLERRKVVQMYYMYGYRYRYRHIDEYVYI